MKITLSTPRTTSRNVSVASAMSPSAVRNASMRQILERFPECGRPVGSLFRFRSCRPFGGDAGDDWRERQKLRVDVAEAGEPMLWLKVGMHKGPCIVVNLNGRLDYFGSTVNIAARLPGFSQGGELIFTEEINDDPEVQEFVAKNARTGALHPFTGDVKGFDEPFTLWRLKV